MDASSMLHNMPTSSAFKAPLLTGSATASLSAPNTITGSVIAINKMLRICFFIVISSIQMVYLSIGMTHPRLSCSAEAESV